MKPALFYSIARDPYGDSWTVVDLRGRFPFASQAEAELEQVQIIENERREQIRRLNEERTAMDRAADERIKALVSAATLPEGGAA